MYCPFCRETIPEAAEFCPSCGKSIAKESLPSDQATTDATRPETLATSDMASPVAPTNPPLDQTPLPASSNATSSEPSGTEPTGTKHKDQLVRAKSEGLKMRWYMFLVFVWFPLDLLGNIGNLLGSVNGAYLSVDPSDLEFIYALYPEIRQYMDVRVCGFILLSVLCVVAWIFMWRFSKKGITLFYANIFASVGFSAILKLYEHSLVSTEGGYSSGDGYMTSYIFGMMLGAALICYLNKRYFDKRKHLFVNP